jgi:ABC-2 type transport system ATP-binding protein
MPIIEIEKLTKTFKTRERAAGLRGSLHVLVAPRYRERLAVKPTSFALEAGEVLAFSGPNGAGKSTTIKMLTGMLTQYSVDQTQPSCVVCGQP